MTSDLPFTDPKFQANYLLGILQVYLEWDIEGRPVSNAKKAEMMNLIQSYAQGDHHVVAAWIANHTKMKG